jgi:hypothetical protein
VQFDHTYLEKSFTGDANISVIGGETVEAEDDDPLPIYKRGAWFDGVDDFIKISGLVVSIEHTIELWIRTETEGGMVFSISKN